FPTGVLNGVESGVLSSVVKDGKVELSLRATAADAEQAAAALAAFDTMWKGFLGEVDRATARGPEMAPLAEVLKGIQYKAEGAKLSADAATADMMPGRFVLPIFVNEASRELGLRPGAGAQGISPADMQMMEARARQAEEIAKARAMAEARKAAADA